ncbi:hypothetical protein PMM47T1_13840 [Pseudomonas sp. M47T1]|nr:hypothetical protein PMM47T1_13840 [Pseudomonas sp. M47T1]
MGRVGADGVPEFTNSQSAQQQAAGQPTLNGFGSGGNFSVGAPGDAARAMAGYQQLHDMRQQWANEDRLNTALAENARNNSFNVIHDSSRPLSLQDRQTDASLDQMRANSLQNVQMAQGVYDDSVQRQGAQQQQRQASRLENLQAAALAPGASAADRAAYQQAVDPTGEKALSRQLTQAKIDQTNAEANKTRADASGTSPAAQLTQMKLDTAKQQQAQAAQDRQKAQAGQVATIDQALGSVDSLLGTKVDPNNPNGPRLDEDPGLSSAVGLQSLIPTRPGSKSADFESRLDTLKAQTFLPQVALLKGQGALSDAEGKKLSDSVGALSTKMSPEAFRKSLLDIRSSFAAARARAAANGAAPAAGATQASSGPAQVSSEAAYAALPPGAEYLDPQGNHRRKP